MNSRIQHVPLLPRLLIFPQVPIEYTRHSDMGTDAGNLFWAKTCKIVKCRVRHLTHIRVGHFQLNPGNKGILYYSG